MLQNNLMVEILLRFHTFQNFSSYFMTILSDKLAQNVTLRDIFTTQKITKIRLANTLISLKTHSISSYHAWQRFRPYLSRSRLRNVAHWAARSSQQANRVDHFALELPSEWLELVSARTYGPHQRCIQRPSRPFHRLEPPSHLVRSNWHRTWKKEKKPCHWRGCFLQEKGFKNELWSSI